MLKKSSVAILSYIFSLEKPCFLNFLKAFNFSDMCAQKCNLTNMQILSFKEISLRHRPNGINIWPKRANKGKQIIRVRNFKHLQSFYFFLSYQSFLFSPTIPFQTANIKNIFVLFAPYSNQNQYFTNLYH